MHENEEQEPLRGYIVREPDLSIVELPDGVIDDEELLYPLGLGESTPQERTPRTGARELYKRTIVKTANDGEIPVFLQVDRDPRSLPEQIIRKIRYRASGIEDYYDYVAPFRYNGRTVEAEALMGSGVTVARWVITVDGVSFGAFEACPDDTAEAVLPELRRAVDEWLARPASRDLLGG